jgi:predicted DNA-binding transcriptional regulator YafY
MKLTANQTTTRTLTDLLRAASHRHAATITYLDSKGALTVRTVELHEVHAKTGDYELVVMCRLENAERHLSLSGILAYTVHRMAYVLTRPQPTTYQRPAPAPTDDADALYTYELERDPDDANYRPRVRLAA